MTRLRSIPLLLAASLLLAAAPDAEQPEPLPRGPVLLQRFIRAVGSEAAVRSVQSMSAQGQIHLPGASETGRFEWAVADGGRCVFDMAFPNLGRSRFGSDGTVGWESLQLGEDTTVQLLDAAVVDQRRRRANWFELALTLPARAKKFETIGQSTFDGTKAYEVRMVDETSQIHHLFFAADTDLLLGVRLIERGPLGPADVTIRFGDWKPVGPLKLFRTVSINHADVYMKLVFEQVSLEPVPPETFAPPESLPPLPESPSESPDV
ncbi:MAG: hypothetical protein QGI75_04455 [Phycisphaerales bacterium]|jgi:hypothetical protein|nr:hypothetical protein [Phycisphaerales bacterium]MDP6889956.1 hypothetical protein [Phycisphaerales bacterium]